MLALKLEITTCLSLIHISLIMNKAELINITMYHSISIKAAWIQQYFYFQFGFFEQNTRLLNITFMFLEQGLCWQPHFHQTRTDLVELYRR